MYAGICGRGIPAIDLRGSGRVGSVHVGRYSVTGAITVVAGAGNDTVTVTINDTKSIPGFLTIDGGDGNDIVRVYSYGSGTIAGRLAVTGGMGDDNVSIAETGTLTV